MLIRHFSIPAVLTFNSAFLARRAIARYQRFLATDKMCKNDGVGWLQKPKRMRYDTHFEINRKSSKERRLNEGSFYSGSESFDVKQMQDYVLKLFKNVE